MSQDDHSTPPRGTIRRIGPPPPRRTSRLRSVLRLVLLTLVIGLLAVAGTLVYRSLNQRGASASVGINLPVNPSLNPLESAALGAYLMVNQDALATPASDEGTPLLFEITPGESAAGIADRLVEQGLILDAAVFRNYLRYYDLDRQLEAGTYQLAPNMTIPQIAQALTNAAASEITIRVTEGWRREQVADFIDQQPDFPFTGADFLAITGQGAAIPPSLAAVIPATGTLEGFLFPDTYRLTRDAAAAELAEKMLANFDTRFTVQMRTDAAATGYSVYQIVALASIVEREAVVAEERPLIAGVYLNRLQHGLKLEADPTVQYALGYQEAAGQWWKLDLTIDDYISVDSPYNTYLYPGLPPGPIASPGIDSIRAVIYPAETTYFFFRAACDGSGRHRFTETYEEHLANACP